MQNLPMVVAGPVNAQGEPATRPLRLAAKPKCTRDFAGFNSSLLNGPDAASWYKERARDRTFVRLCSQEATRHVTGVLIFEQLDLPHRSKLLTKKN
jgi:hypothetical protein